MGLTTTAGCPGHPGKTINLLGLTFGDLTRILEDRYGKGAYHASHLIRQVIGLGHLRFWEADAFERSPILAEQLKPVVRLKAGTIVRTVEDNGVMKFVTRLEDGLAVESVIIPMTRYNTLCVSCQVGCRMGCRFCETGRMGLKRNLSAAEITAQLYNARHILGKPVKNIVFMGMGEPFDNQEAVFRAIEILTDPKGFNLSLRHITVSTAGLTDGIQALADRNWPQIHLAVSVNAAIDATRSRLMPINRKIPLAALRQALVDYPLKKRNTILMEYILIRGVNDSAEDARALAEFIGDLPVRLNLIAVNPIQGSSFQSPGDDGMHLFRQLLTDLGVFVIHRWSKGRSVTAGCGQLGVQAADPGSE